eukprot:UN14465
MHKILLQLYDNLRNHVRDTVLMTQSNRQHACFLSSKDCLGWCLHADHTLEARPSVPFLIKPMMIVSTVQQIMISFTKARFSFSMLILMCTRTLHPIWTRKHGCIKNPIFCVSILRTKIIWKMIVLII